MHRGGVHLGRVVLALGVALLLVSLGLVKPHDAVAQGFEIEPDGLGPLALGASIDDAAAGLPAGYDVSEPQAVGDDLEAVVVTFDGATHALAFLDDAGAIGTVVVLDGAYRTAEGVGPGSNVGSVQGAYSGIALELGLADDGERVTERISLDTGPDNVTFRTSEDGEDLAGLYGSGRSLTVLFDPAASVTSVWIGPEDPAVVIDLDLLGVDAATQAAAAAEAAPPAEEPAEEIPAEPAEEEPAEPAEEEPAEEEPAEEEPAEEEPAEEEPAEEEPAEEEPAMVEEPETDEPVLGNGAGSADELPATGVESTLLAMVGIGLAAAGAGLVRVGQTEPDEYGRVRWWTRPLS